MDPALWDKYADAPQKPRRKPLGADVRLLILQKLQGKLDLALLFEIFTREMEKQIDIHRLIWELEGTATLIRRGKATEYRQTFVLRFGENELGKLQYCTPYKLDQDEINLLHTYHRLFAGPLANAIEYRRVKNLALQDYLSTLGNRTSFEQDIRHAIALSERRNVGLVLIIFDLDNFKQVNDRFGHLDGDKVIRRFATILKDAVRATDRCYRLGGDEFTALLQPATGESASKVATRIQLLMKQDQTLRALNISVSLGYAHYQKGDTSISLIDRADRQLYQHKRQK
ncbi:GGDEF domain-containing protein [Photobacterium sanguinicancri]|uniref:diguanylate cyclase n=1 Tax=Photobacterium sanguinicancri TaxID=875932 RepID=A0AAW7YC34_9GAMM|nr:GGDEF domain-containing protein [Photobacterium sanguinicancri]MDO6544843.1 GGDEF domain-containing protein [Photobacterium sanguinicancri]OZS45717.1 GGDEF domain-containing protein [Photobacterium sanguinicancri]